MMAEDSVNILATEYHQFQSAVYIFLSVLSASRMQTLPLTRGLHDILMPAAHKDAGVCSVVLCSTFTTINTKLQVTFWATSI